MNVEKARDLIEKAQKKIRYRHAGSFAEEDCDKLLNQALSELSQPEDLLSRFRLENENLRRKIELLLKTIKEIEFP